VVETRVYPINPLENALLSVFLSVNQSVRLTIVTAYLQTVFKMANRQLFNGQIDLAE
jgi:hypothetical protein